MTVDDVEIPQEIMTHLRELVQGAEDDAILAFARTEPSVAKGLRLKTSSVPGIRTRILRKLKNDGELEMPLRMLLLATCPIARAVMTLSESSLMYAWEALVSLYGTPFLTAALLEPRVGLHEAAVEWLEEEEAETADLPAPEDAGDLLADILSDINMPLLPALREINPPVGDEADAVDDGIPPPPADMVPQEKYDALQARFDELVAELEGQRTLKHRIKSLEKKVEQAEQHREKLAARLPKAEAAVKRADKEKRAAQRETEAQRKRADDLEQDTEQRVSQRVDERMESILNSWALPLRALDTAETTGDATAENLVKRAEEAVSRQSATDRHAGNARRIRERLHALDEALKTVRQAAADAIHPLPELATVATELEREIAQLESVLGKVAPTVTPFETRVRGRIAAARELDDLQEVRRGLQQLEAFGVLREAELVRLYQAYNRSMSTIYTQFGPKVVKAADWDDPVWRLKHAADNAAEIQLFIDGHNVLHLVPELFADDFEDGVPKGQARDHLVNLLQRMFYGHAECSVRVYFDSPEHTERRRGANIREIYSGGEGEHRADDMIAHDLERLHLTDPQTPRMLVTDDRDLRERAARHGGAQVMGVAQFSALLMDLG